MFQQSLKNKQTNKKQEDEQAYTAFKGEIPPGCENQSSKREEDLSDTQCCLGNPEGEFCQYLNGSHFKVPGSSSWQYLHTT